MKIIIFTPKDHIYSNIITKELISEFKNDIVMIVESDVLIPGKPFLRSIAKYISTAGIYYFICQSVKQIFFKIVKNIIFDKSNIYFPYTRLAGKFKINVIKENNINNSNFINKINMKKPDLLISVYFRQIFGEEILGIPHKGSINIHPAPLPRYRGVSPIFWALVNGEKYSAVTIHYITATIDGGNVISQKSIPICEDDSEHKIFIKCSLTGSKMLSQAIKDIKNSVAGGCPQQGESSYYSLPTKKAVRELKKRNKYFYKIRELFNGKTTLPDTL